MASRNRPARYWSSPRSREASTSLGSRSSVRSSDDSASSLRPRMYAATPRPSQNVGSSGTCSLAAVKASIASPKRRSSTAVQPLLARATGFSTTRCAQTEGDTSNTVASTSNGTTRMATIGVSGRSRSVTGSGQRDASDHRNAQPPPAVVITARYCRTVPSGAATMWVPPIREPGSAVSPAPGGSCAPHRREQGESRLPG